MRMTSVLCVAEEGAPAVNELDFGRVLYFVCFFSSTSSVAMLRHVRKLLSSISRRHARARSAAENFFGFSEICEAILILVGNGKDGVRKLFALQRISVTFRKVILGSPTLKARMGLDYDFRGAPYVDTLLSAAVISLQYKLSFLRFHVASKATAWSLSGRRWVGR